MWDSHNESVSIELTLTYKKLFIKQNLSIAAKFVNYNKSQYNEISIPSCVSRVVIPDPPNLFVFSNLERNKVHRIFLERVEVKIMHHQKSLPKTHKIFKRMLFLPVKQSSGCINGLGTGTAGFWSLSFFVIPAAMCPTGHNAGIYHGWPAKNILFWTFFCFSINHEMVNFFCFFMSFLSLIKSWF